VSTTSGPGRSGASRPIGEIIEALVRRKRFYEKSKYGRLVDAWTELVGEVIAERTRISSFKEGELVVAVDSSVLLHELTGFLREQLLAGIQGTKAGRDVARIRFRLGYGEDA
jgi:predicted nucleic acid-binding Zn ribbon protein